MTIAAARQPGPRFVPPALIGVAALLVALLIMELLVQFNFVSRFIVPPPSEIIGSFGRVIVEEHVFSRFLLTLGECLTAGVMLTVFGIAGGVLMHRIKILQQACETWVAAMAAAPLVLAYPLFMVIFGRNEITLIIMGFLPGVIPLIIQVEQGFRDVSSTLINVGRSFGVTGWQNFWKIMIPAAAPNIFTGFRLALIYTLINIIAIEYLVDIGGLGRIVADRYFRFDISGTYTAIIAVAAISMLLNWLIGRLERWVRPT